MEYKEIYIQDVISGETEVTVDEGVSSYKAKLLDFDFYDSKVLNLNNYKTYFIPSSNIVEYSEKIFSDYIWEQLYLFYKIKDIVDFSDLEKASNGEIQDGVVDIIENWKFQR